MRKIKFGFRNQSAGQQLAVFERTVKNLAALPPEYLEQTEHEKLAGVVSDLRKSHNQIASLRAQLKEEISRRKHLLSEARKATIRSVGMAAINMNNDSSKLMTLGFPLNAPWSRLSAPDAPTHLRAEPTDSPGEAKLRWKRPMRDCFFEIQAQSDPFSETGWKSIQMTCFKQSFLAAGLTSGGKYWFRVRASNARGQGPWSELATVRVK